MPKRALSKGIGNRLIAKIAGVQTAYTEQDVSTLIRAKKGAEMSLRAIAAEYGPPIKHMDIKRILQGKFPHDTAKRATLKLPPICVSCGQKVKRVRVMPAWVSQAADFLTAREKNTTTKPTQGHKEDSIRVYSRGGKRVPA